MYDYRDEKNPNKLSAELRGTMLWSQLVGSDKDVARKIPREGVMSKNGAQAVVASVNRRNPLSSVSSVYSDFQF